MDQYLTTYRKDYTWPSTGIKRGTAALREADSCRCDTPSRELKVVELCGDDQDWSRVGPMGRLLDPKLYPAKTGPSPETEATKYDQPSTYMRKLEEKHPNLYGILQSTSMGEIIKRVDEDRLKTTYQVDFSEKATSMFDTTPAQCVTAKQAVKEECVSSGRSRLKRDDKEKKEERRKSKKVEEEGQETRLPPWRSEYQDSISRLGHVIMKTKVHQKKKQGPAWAMGVL